MPSWRDESRVPSSVLSRSSDNQAPTRTSNLLPSEQPVRKVCYTSTSFATGGGTGTGNGRSSGKYMHSNSRSWRVGRRVAEEVLRENREQEQQQQQEEKEAGGLASHDDFSPPSARLSHSSSLSSVRPEIKISPPSNPPAGTGGMAGGRSTGAASNYTHESTHNLSLEPGKVALDLEEEEEGGAQSPGSSNLSVRADKLSSDMKQLMDELKSPSSPRLQARKGGAESGGGAQQQRSGVSPVRGRYDKPWRTNMREKGRTLEEAGAKKPKLSSG